MSVSWSTTDRALRADLSRQLPASGHHVLLSRVKAETGPKALVLSLPVFESQEVLEGCSWLHKFEVTFSGCGRHLGPDLESALLDDTGRDFLFLSLIQESSLACHWSSWFCP